MQLTILSPTRTIFEGEITKITCPGSEGSFQILNNHIPFISLLEKGVLTYQKESTIHRTFIHGGLLKVEKNNILVLTT